MKIHHATWLWIGLACAAAHPVLESSSSRGCYCALDKVKLMDNEIIKKNAAGSYCVGGCGGQAFALQKNMGIVRKLTVWHGGSHEDKNNGLKAIRLSYFDELEDQIIGSPELAVGYEEITFNPGETLVGDLVISGNGFGSRAGYIKFETSKGQTFEVGQSDHAKYLFDSGDSFISAIAGRAGLDIDQIFFILWKPIKSLEMKNMTYPTIDTLEKTKNPTVVANKEYCNDNDEDRNFVARTKVTSETIGSDACFSFGFSENIGASAEMSGGIPGLVDVHATAHWDVGASQNFKNCYKKSTTSVVTIEFPSPTLKPHTRTSYKYTQWQGSLSKLPFTATMVITFTDGSTVSRSESGTYKGTDFTTVQQSWTKEEHDVVSCSSLNDEPNVVVIV